MLTTKINSLRQIINQGHERSIKAKKNILLSILIKGGSVAISLLLVPLTVNYVNPKQYGLWITLSSIIAWITFFDIGFGNGLRNKLAECIAKGEHELGKIYVSTTYAIICIIITFFLLAFICLNPYLRWSQILNAPANMDSELSLVALIVFVFFSIQFLLKLITTITTANQEPAKGPLIDLISSVLALSIIFTLIKTTSGNLLYLASTLSIVPAITLILATIYLYKTSYKKYAPSLKYVKFRYAKNLIGLGIKFFVIQMGALILFQTDNIIITQLYGPEEVTTYNIAYKLFSIVIMVFTILVTPLWSAFTDAYEKSELDWIKSTLDKMFKIWTGLIVLTASILTASPFIFKLWMGDSVSIPFSLSIALSFYIIAYTWQTIHVFFLNGIGKITLQLYLVIISSIVNIPLAILLTKWIGLAGISVASTILFAVMGTIFYIQTRRILGNKAYGIWDK